MQLLDSAEPPFLLIVVVLFINKITDFWKHTLGADSASLIPMNHLND